VPPDKKISLTLSLSEQERDDFIHGFEKIRLLLAIFPRKRSPKKKLAFFPFGSEEEMASQLLRSAKPPFPPEVGKASC